MPDEFGTETIREDRFRIQVDRSLNWDASELTDASGVTDKELRGRNTMGFVQLLKFTPAKTGNYDYVSECANRGTCDRAIGLCECFKGYTGGACSSQSPIQ